MGVMPSTKLTERQNSLPPTDKPLKREPQGIQINSKGDKCREFTTKKTKWLSWMRKIVTVSGAAQRGKKERFVFAKTKERLEGEFVKMRTGIILTTPVLWISVDFFANIVFLPNVEETTGVIWRNATVIFF